MRLFLFLISIWQFQPVWSQMEKLEIEGAIILGASENPLPDPGTIRWTGSDFEGWDGMRWISLTAQIMFDPELPDVVQIDSIILLDSVQSYTVPSGKNLHLSSLTIMTDGSDPTFKVDGVSFGSIGVGLTHYDYLVIGEDMTITSTHYINANGYLAPKNVDLIVHDLSAASYTVPVGKTLYITTQGYPHPVDVDGVLFNLMTTLYGGQTLSASGGPGAFIGYLK